MSVILVIKLDGQTVSLDSGDPFTSARHFGGGSIDRLPDAFHLLEHDEVWHLDDWHGQPVNLSASRLIGLRDDYEPLRRTVVLTPLPDGQDSRVERAHQRQFFGMLDAVNSGFCTAPEAQSGMLIHVKDSGAA
ncbi:hypothetical protein E7T09_20425 [Deinococcus sp. KSM4-11]|uniref:hypothetical protein n=1 Tax=Deinococcus sp. KSM4-11 TaxID=2568654 RepID=UPI0010A5967A|nr:hypothetical protein [Deinococcus sp. KSM4-11]THF84373.1 hypothetical protein E7T09_20425 [Deinococcus sp. KSM4-11]